jgi:hypothetical protein
VQSSYLVPGPPFEPVAMGVCVVFIKDNKNMKEKKIMRNPSIPLEAHLNLVRQSLYLHCYVNEEYVSLFMCRVGYNGNGHLEAVQNNHSPIIDLF